MVFVCQDGGRGGPSNQKILRLNWVANNIIISHEG